jgi:hypothetical protein
MLAEENPDALLYDERFDSALVGWTLGFGVKSDTRPVAVYDYQSLVRILAADFERDAERDAEDLEEHDFVLEAEEWVGVNMAGAYLGPNAPVIAAMRGISGASDLESCLVSDCGHAGIHRAPGGSAEIG